MQQLKLMKRFYQSSLLLAVMSLSACGVAEKTEQQQTRQIEHVRGVSTVPAHPEKVVVFDTSSLDSLTLLGFSVAGVPQSSVTYPDFMQRYASADYFNAGTLFEPDFEKLSEQNPDFIIAGGRARDAYDELSKIAPTIDISLDTSDIVSSLHKQVLTLGEVYNDVSRAEKLLTEFDNRIASVKAQTEQAGTAMVVMVVGGRLSAYGPGSRFGFIFDALGFKPALELESQGLHGNPMPFELLLKADPDWLFVLSRDAAIGQAGAESAAQVLNNDIVNKTKAMQSGKVIYLDSSSVYLAGGIQTYYKLLDTVSAALAAAK